MINDSNNTNNKPEIVDWKASDKFSFSAFRRKQQKILDLGFNQSLTLTTMKHACPDCNNKQACLSFTKGDIELCFCLCVQCWQVVELYPVYEDSELNDFEITDIKVTWHSISGVQVRWYEGLIGIHHNGVDLIDDSEDI